MRLDSETVREQALLYFFMLTPLYFLAQKNLHFQDQMLFRRFAVSEGGGKGYRIIIKAGFSTILCPS